MTHEHHEPRIWCLLLQVCLHKKNDLRFQVRLAKHPPSTDEREMSESRGVAHGWSVLQPVLHQVFSLGSRAEWESDPWQITVSNCRNAVWKPPSANCAEVLEINKPEQKFPNIVWCSPGNHGLGKPHDWCASRISYHREQQQWGRLLEWLLENVLLSDAAAGGRYLITAAASALCKVDVGT